MIETTDFSPLPYSIKLKIAEVAMLEDFSNQTESGNHIFKEKIPKFQPYSIKKVYNSKMGWFFWTSQSKTRSYAYVSRCESEN